MNKRSITSAAFLIGTLFLVPQRSTAVFTSIQKTALRAAVTIGGSSGTLALSAPQLLPLQDFFGKNVVIPVEVTNVANPFTLQVILVYQLLDAGGNPLGQQVSIAVPLQAEVGVPNAYSGLALIPVGNLLAAKNGGQLAYFLQADQSGAPIASFKNNGSPFQIQFISTKSYPVDQNGSVVSLPDPYLPDGNTTLTFAPNSLTGPGTLIATQLDPNTVPAGPGGLLPVVVYSFELQGTSLRSEAQITLSYAANLDGSIIGSNGSASNLAPYRLEGFNWTLLGPKQISTTQHTVAFTTPHFSTYALFLSGATSGSDLRPRQRILTPNGDGINDTIDFSGIGADSAVHIFDIKGRRIRTLNSPNLAWDGRDDSGSIVESGLYMYQYTALGQRVSGLILVAK